MTLATPTPQSEKPSAVVTAVGLFYLALAVGLVQGLVKVSRFSEKAYGSVALLILLFTFGVMAWLIHMTACGRNWARITVLVLFLLGVPLSVHPLLQSLQHSPVLGLLGLLQVALQIVALVMLFGQRARPWFRSTYKPVKNGS